MFFTNLQEYSMHKSVIILSILFFGFDLNAGKHSRDSEVRRLAALGIDYNGPSHEKKKRQSFGSDNSVTELALSSALKKCKLLKRENDDLRLKLAVSPDELGKTGESSNPDRLSLDSGSRGISPMIGKDSSHNELSQATSPIAIVISKSCQNPTVEERYPYYVESPCGPSRLHYFSGPSSFPGYDHFSLTKNKKVSQLAPVCSDCP